MVGKQRRGMDVGEAVVDGRDIGTVVCAGAELKIYVTATVAERARRRRLEVGGKGVQVSQKCMEQDIVARDDYDSNRPVAPLRAAADAVVVDTTDLDIGEVVQMIAEIAKSAGVPG